MITAWVTQFLKLYPNFEDGSDTKTKVRAFQFVLKDNAFEKFLDSDIELFFQDWIKNGKKMPLPSDAYNFCKDKMKHRAYIESTKSYPRISAGSGKDRVKWYGLSYDEIYQAGMGRELESHVQDLINSKGLDAADDYIKYLKTHNKSWKKSFKPEMQGIDCIQNASELEN